MGFLSDALGSAGSWLGRKAGEGVASILPFKKGGRVGMVIAQPAMLKRGGKAKKTKKRADSPEPMRRGGKAHMKKGSKAAKDHMAKLRAMRK